MSVIAIRRTFLVLLLATACAGGQEAAPGSSSAPLTVEEVAADPEAYAGERIRIRAGYYAAREASVLTPGFAESYPPQPMDPQIWVVATPPDACLQRAETVAWADRVVAEGTLRFQEGGGLGHLGSYELALDDARISCP